MLRTPDKTHRILAEGKYPAVSASWRDRTVVRGLIILAVPLLFGLAAALLWFSDPQTGRGPMLCLLYQFSGIYCPGCGTSRALHSLLRLRWREALSYNIFMLIWLPLPLWAVFGEWLRAIAGRPLIPPITDRRWLIWALLISCIMFVLMRNLPWPLFSWLAP